MCHTTSVRKTTMKTKFQRWSSDRYGMKGLTEESVFTLNSLLSSFERLIQVRYTIEQQQAFRNAILESVKRNNGSKRVDQKTKVRYYHRTVHNARVLASDGPPTRIQLKDGTTIPISTFIQPKLSPSGNMMWWDPISNISFTKRGEGHNELEQNRVTGAASLANGQIEAATKHYKKFKKSLGNVSGFSFGSSKAARLREPSQKEINGTWESLSEEQKEAFRICGLDRASIRIDSMGFRDPRSAHQAFFADNPDHKERRGKEILAAYLRQTPAPGKRAISPWTGLELEMPGVRGVQQCVADHVTPISSFYPDESEWTGEGGEKWSQELGERITSQADQRDNIILGESGLNNRLGAQEDWDKVIVKWERDLKKFKKNLNSIKFTLPVFTNN